MEARKRDIPIVQLNPGGVLNWKYEGECAARAAGFPYAVVRCTGARAVAPPRGGRQRAPDANFPPASRAVRPWSRRRRRRTRRRIELYRRAGGRRLSPTAGLDDGAGAGPALLEADQGDAISGKVSRAEAAELVRDGAARRRPRGDAGPATDLASRV